MAESSQIVAKYDRIIANYHYHYEALQIHTKQESSLITTLCQSFPVPSLPPTSKKAELRDFLRQRCGNLKVRRVCQAPGSLEGESYTATNHRNR